MSRPRAVHVVIAALLAAGLLAGCSSHARPAAAPTPSATPSATPKPPPPPPVSPLSGLPAAKGLPVVVIKIDNTLPAHPQVGVNAADLVYMEQVEGGLTRLAAVYSTHVPSRVGPVRSARESDVELLGAYGRVPLGFSGANGYVLAIVHGSALVDASVNTATGYYQRSGDRHAPYNLFVDPQGLLRAFPTGARAHDIGLRFGGQRGGIPVASFRVPVASANVSWVYDPTHQRWVLSMDGAQSRQDDGSPVAAANVILQYVDVRASGMHDVIGNITPYNVTIGSGSAVVFRDGRRINGTWARNSLGSVTRYRDGLGHDILLRAGTTWVLLVSRGAPLFAVAPPKPRPTANTATPTSAP